MSLIIPPRALSPLMPHEVVFREFWLPQVAPLEDFSRVPLSLLKELYADVYEFGPHADECWTLLDAVETLVDRLVDTTLATYDPRLPQVFMNDLRDTYGPQSEGFGIVDMYGLNHAYVAEPYHGAADPWVRNLWLVGSSERLDARVIALYNGGLHLHAPQRMLTLFRGLVLMAQVVVLRCLPCDESQPEARERVWALHDAFCARWQLPLLVR